MNIGILLNKFFTVNSFNKLVSGERSVTYQNIVNELINPLDSITNLQAMNLIYKYMSKRHRNEYFYKNTLLNKILLGRHSIQTSTALRELPINGNILDFLIINGIGQVYEIKTELDNLQRLKGQLNAYYHAFSICNVVTDQSHLKQIMQNIDLPQVGILVLTKRNTLHEERKATKYEEKLDYKSIFKILRKYEFEHILKKSFGFLPQVNDFQYYDACFQMFKQLGIQQAQQEMLYQLKQRRTVDDSNIKEFNKVPIEIKGLIYFSNYTEKNFKQLNQFLTQKIGDE